MATHQLSVIVFGWMNRNKFVKLMNGWMALRKKLSKPWVTHPPVAVAGSGTQLGFIFIGLIYIIVPTVLPAACHVSFTPAHDHWLMEVSFLSLVGGFLGLSEALKDIKVVLIFHELVTHFRQVNKTSF